MLNFTVEVRDANLTRVGQLRLEDITITFTDRYNNVGDWTITLIPQHPLAPVLRTPGAGIIVTDIVTGEVLMSGPVADIQSGASADDPEGTLTITGASDDIIASDRLAYADPTKADASAATVLEDVRTAKGETLMHQYVDANVGPSAPTGRRISSLTMGADGGRGSIQTQRANYPILGTLLSTIATSDRLGFRFRQVGSTVEFQTYGVLDRSATVRLDIRNNTLSSHTTNQAPASATRIIVAGKPADDADPAAPRPMVEVSTPDSVASETAWHRRIEVYQDERSTTDPVELTQQGQSTLADSGLAQLAIQAVPMNDTTMVYGRDWGLGDQIAVVVDGVELPSIVTGAVIKADSDGITMGALIGDPAVFGDGNTGLTTRISNLERSPTAAGSAVPVSLDPTAYTNATPPTAYPQYESFMFIANEQGVPGGWPMYTGRSVWGVVRTFRWSSDDTTQQWQTVGSGSAELWTRAGNTSGFGPWRNAGTLVSEVRLWAGGAVPYGWALCDGTAVARTGTYAALFAAIGTNFGTGDGSTTFNLPDLRGRVPVGFDTTQTDFNRVGRVGGEKTHTLTIAEMPAHDHQPNWGFDPGPSNLGKVRVDLNSPAHDWGRTDLTGGGGAHNNLQPYLTLNYIIKF